jgi:hypothetical protein
MTMLVTSSEKVRDFVPFVGVTQDRRDDARLDFDARK